MIDNSFLEYGQEMIVIREIFDGAHELFENELERALEFGCPTIVIEPCRLGEETARWIYFGEYLTRYTILTGFSSIITGLFWPERIFIQCSLLGSALLANGFHLISWQQDICSNYRVEKNPEQFLKLMALQQQQSSSSEQDNISLITTATTIESPSFEETTEEDCDGDDEGDDDDDDQDQDQGSVNDDVTKVQKSHKTTSITATTLSINMPKKNQSSKSKKREKQQQQQQKRHHLHGSTNLKPTNPYEMILSTSVRKQKLPVVLCRRTNQEIRRSNLLTAAVSLLAIAFSLIRFVRNSFLSYTSAIDSSTLKTASSPSSSNLVSKLSFLGKFGLI